MFGGDEPRTGGGSWSEGRSSRRAHRAPAGHRGPDRRRGRANRRTGRGRGGPGRGLPVSGARGVHERPEPHRPELGKRQPGAGVGPAGDAAVPRHHERGPLAPCGRAARAPDRSRAAAPRRRLRPRGADELALVQNTSEAMEIVQCGRPRRAGGEVLTTTRDYGCSPPPGARLVARSRFAARHG